MTRDRLKELIEDFSENSPTNYFDKKDAVPAETYGALAGMRFFQRPVYAIARADDPLFAKLKHPDVVGGHHFAPEDWIDGAKSVISVFLPIESSTVAANKADPNVPAVEWVCTRIDGEKFLLALGGMICDELKSEGFKAVHPSNDSRFVMQREARPVPGTENIPQYSSNWSERHVAFVTGLGTFGQSTNFISKAGCAGRLISIVTDWDIAPDTRECGDDWLGYCNDCGACKRHCPAHAYFNDRHGKEHATCAKYFNLVSKKYFPRYGCGKCQAGMPCENKPMKRKN